MLATVTPRHVGLKQLMQADIADAPSLSKSKHNIRKIYFTNGYEYNPSLFK